MRKRNAPVLRPTLLYQLNCSPFPSSSSFSAITADILRSWLDARRGGGFVNFLVPWEFYDCPPPPFFFLSFFFFLFAPTTPDSESLNRCSNMICSCIVTCAFPCDVTRCVCLSRGMLHLPRCTLQRSLVFVWESQPQTP